MKTIFLILYAPIALLALILILPILAVGIYYTGKELKEKKINQCPDCGEILNPNQPCQNSHCQIKKNWREAKAEKKEPMNNEEKKEDTLTQPAEELKDAALRYFIRDRVLHILKDEIDRGSKADRADTISQRINTEIIQEFAAVAKDEIAKTLSDINQKLTPKK